MVMVLVISGCGDDDAPTSSNSGGTGGGGTTISPVYAFQTDSAYQPGDLKTNASNFESICSNAFRNVYSPSVSCTNFYPMLGKSSTNGLKNFISTNSLNTSAAVKLIDGTTTIASSLQDFIANGPALKGTDTWIGWSEGYWYSGVASDAGSGNNCSNYTDDTSSTTMAVATNSTYFSWADRSPVCDYYDTYPYVCLCN